MIGYDSLYLNTSRSKYMLTSHSFDWSKVPGKRTSTINKPELKKTETEVQIGYSHAIVMKSKIF